MATLNLYQGSYDTGTLGLLNVDLVYRIGDNYFCFYEDRLKIYRFYDGRLSPVNDIYFSLDKSSRKFISLNKDKLHYQEIVDHKSYLGSYNHDGSTYEPLQPFPFINPIISAWNNERIVIEPYNYNLYINGLDNKRQRTYPLNQPLIWISNPVYLHEKVYFLARFSDGLYGLVILDDFIHISGIFTVDFSNVDETKITISIENGRLCIWCPTMYKDQVFFITRPLEEMGIVCMCEGEITHKGANLGPFLSEKRRFIPADRFHELSSLVKGIDTTKENPAFIDVHNFHKHFRAFVVLEEPSVMETEKTMEIKNPEVHLKDNSYIKYIHWIIENYDNYNVSTVIFYNDFIAKIPFHFSDRYIDHNINLYQLSLPFDNFVIPMGKCSLHSGRTYIRKFSGHSRYLSMDNLQTLNGFCRENGTDYWHEDLAMNSIVREKIIHFFVSLGISHTELLWTPIMFYKVDMRLIREKPKEYYQTIFNVLDKDYNLNSVMSYLFYSLIYHYRI